MSENDCKPKIDYPCSWTYKVIGRDVEELNRAIAEVVGQTEHAVTCSRASKGGAYQCLNVTVTVESEAVRLALYQRLCRHPAIVIVM
jgi:uncharacterized protein